MSLLQKATATPNRLKMYIYGPSGSGKTVTSLHFPNVAMVDAEKGTDYYGSMFDFERIQTSDPKEIESVINELLENPGKFKTFVIDPYTMVNDTLVSQYESRLKNKKGDPNYTLQPSDYKYLKSATKNFIQKLLALDMNIIVTARSSTLYSEGGFMQAIGVKPEGPKEMPYLFDVVLRLDRKDNKFWAYVEKDRTNKLPAEFEFSYASFVQYIGVEGLEREPVIFRQKAAIQNNTGRKTLIKFEGEDLYTAGIDAKNLAKIQKLAEKIGEEELAEIVKSDYLVDSALDLKNDEAVLLIEDLTKKIKESK